jgi:protein-S-isoprenylcysteine O-methyltransferase Ste14
MLFFLRSLLLIALLGGVLFGAAGRWDLPCFWVYLGLFAVLLLASQFVLPREVQQERLGLGKPGEDRLLRLFLLPFYLGFLAVAGLDAGRFGWSGQVPLAVQVGGLAAVAVAWGWVFWAVAVNRFFAPAVRLQPEREQRVIASGPYGFIRHPTYAGVALSSLASSPALGSWWALLPALGCVVLLVRRTALEDRFLRAQLEGYADYAAKVRSRLLPGVW